MAFIQTLFTGSRKSSHGSLCIVHGRLYVTYEGGHGEVEHGGEEQGHCTQDQDSTLRISLRQHPLQRQACVEGVKYNEWVNASKQQYKQGRVYARRLPTFAPELAVSSFLFPPLSKYLKCRSAKKKNVGWSLPVRSSDFFSHVLAFPSPSSLFSRRTFSSG